MATAEYRRRVSPKRILVVEDEMLAALSIRTVLMADGHLVEITEDAERALALLQASPYDIVLTDFKLPNMDGLELADTIKRDYPGMPVILITAYAEKIGGTMGKVSNVDLVVSKPFSVPELQRAVQSMFEPPPN
jgi:two-component system response regulator GlrR